jgi:hypothetical protein
VQLLGDGKDTVKGPAAEVELEGIDLMLCWEAMGRILFPCGPVLVRCYKNGPAKNE